MSEESTSSESIETSQGEDSSSLASESNNESAGEVVNELQDQVQAAVDAGASKEEIKEMIEEFELKVNGKTIKQKLDWNDKEAIKRELQKAHAFNDVSQEYASVKKQLNSKIEQWKKDPIQLFKDMGIDKEQFLKSEIEKELEDLQLTPQEKKIRELEAKQAEYDAREKEMQERAEAAERQRQDEQALSILRSEIQGALAGHPFLKPSEDTERRIADTMAAYSVKYPDITAEQVLPIVEADYKREIEHIFNNIPEEYIEKLLSKTALEKIGKKAPKPVAPPKPKVMPKTMNQIAVPTAGSVEAKQKAENAKPRSFEDMMSSR